MRNKFITQGAYRSSRWQKNERARQIIAKPLNQALREGAQKWHA
jgi:hypothetical protein